MLMLRAISVTVCALALSVTVQAEPLFPDDEFSEDEFAEAASFDVFTELTVRQDAVRNLPRPQDSDFDRTWLRARIGFIWSNDLFDIGLTGKINQNSDDNDDSRRNLDNEAADDESIDDAFVAYRYSSSGFVQIGQAPLPIQLGPMVWDPDLRPRGLTLSQEFSLGDYSTLEVTAGTYQINHVFDDEAELDALQLGFSLGEGLPIGFSSHLAYLSFSELGDLALNGIARTNSRGPAGLGEEFDLVDWQFDLLFSQLPKPLRLSVDLLRNLEAGDNAARFQAVYGVSQDQPGLELGFSTQRVQQDAVIAAFSDDDWWFPTNLRGSSVWMAYGFNESLRLRFAAFTERRDDQSDNNRRYMLELRWSI